MNACIQCNGSTSEYFKVRSGVKQGCVLAPTLFAIYLLLSFNMPLMGTRMELTSDSMGLFSIGRLKSRRPTTEVLIRELLFADDAAIATHSEIELQRLVDCLAKACDLFKLTISVKKTEVIRQGTNSPPEIKLGGESLKTVDKFVYLGSTIMSTLSLDEELTSSIGMATAALKKLVKRAWENDKLRVETKALIYQTCVLSTLLYWSETWTLYADQERRLNSFHMRCLRNILKIKWQDRIPDTEVRKRAGTQSLYPILWSRRLRWLGHIACMDNSRIPKQILYGELSEAHVTLNDPSFASRTSEKRP